MRIRIREKGEPERQIVIPTALFCNRAAAWIAAAALKKKGQAIEAIIREESDGDVDIKLNVTAQQLTTLMQALRQGQKVLGSEPMVWVQENDGDEVEIYL